MLAMNLTIGDLATLCGLMATLLTAFAIMIRYFVKSEIRDAIGNLELKLARERTLSLADAERLRQARR